MKTRYKPDITINPTFMRDIGKAEIELIRNDFDQGITQSPLGARTSPYRSAQYKKYKANRMRRFTNKSGKGTKGTLLRGITSVVSDVTNIKNYKLTGNLFRRLKVESVKENEVVIGFNQLDIGKIIGAADNGDVIVGLNSNNQETIKEAVFKEMSKQIDDWCKDDINFTISVIK